jgi:hypothetical protein
MRIQAGAPRGGFWCVSWAVFEVDILLLVLRKVLLVSGLGFCKEPEFQGLRLEDDSRSLFGTSPKNLKEEDFRF